MKRILKILVLKIFVLKILVLSLIAVIGSSHIIYAQVGYIQIEASAGIAIFMDGVFKGNTSRDYNGLILQDVPVGAHVIRAVREGFAAQEKTITVEENQVYLYKLSSFTPKISIKQTGESKEGDVTRKVGDLLIQSIPIEAQITIASLGLNNSYKSKDRWLAEQIGTGEYLITAKSIGKTLTKQVKIQAGFNAHLFFNFLKETTKLSYYTTPPKTFDINYIEKLIATAKANPTFNLALSLNPYALLLAAQTGKKELLEQLIKAGVAIYDAQINPLAGVVDILTQAIKRNSQDGRSLIRTLKGHTDDVESVAFSPDGQTIASGSSDKSIKLWNSQDGRLIRTLKGHTGRVRSVAFSPDGQTIASGSDDNTIKLWNSQDGSLIQTLTGHTHWVWSVAFSPDGQTLASGSSDNTIKLWNSQDGRLIRTLTGHSRDVWSVVFSPDGQTLASGSWDNTIKLWDSQDGRLIRTLTGHSDAVQSIAFSPDGQTIASGSADTTIKLWNSQDGRLIRTLTGHTDWVWSVAFSPDGKTIASGSFDKTIKLWNSQDGRLIRTLRGHSGWVNSVAFSPDGQTIASGSADNTIKLWDPSSYFNLDLDLLKILLDAGADPNQPLLSDGDSSSLWQWVQEQNITPLTKLVETYLYK